MAPKKSNISVRQLLSVLTLAVLGAAFVFFVSGYILGSQQSSTLSFEQEEYVQGLVQGTKFKIDYEKYKAEGPLESPKDFRAVPETRCAGMYFPLRPAAMAGCLQGLKDRPPEGYRLPNR